MKGIICDSNIDKRRAMFKIQNTGLQPAVSPKVTLHKGTNIK